MWGKIIVVAGTLAVGGIATLVGVILTNKETPSPESEDRERDASKNSGAVSGEPDIPPREAWSVKKEAEMLLTAGDSVSQSMDIFSAQHDSADHVEEAEEELTPEQKRIQELLAPELCELKKLNEEV